jgi:hypothetical protein
VGGRCRVLDSIVIGRREMVKTNKKRFLCGIPIVYVFAEGCLFKVRAGRVCALRVCGLEGASGNHQRFSQFSSNRLIPSAQMEGLFKFSITVQM